MMVIVRESVFSSSTITTSTVDNYATSLMEMENYNYSIKKLYMRVSSNKDLLMDKAKFLMQAIIS